MALPNALTGVRGVLDTGDRISQEKPLEIGDMIWTHEPNKNKGLAWCLRNGYTEPTKNHIFGHLEDAPYANWVEYAGAIETSQATTGLEFSSGQGERLTTGSRVYFPDIQEVIRIDAAMSNDTTVGVTRNYGRGAAATSLLKPGHKGLIMTPAFQQGFTTGSAFATNKVYKAFATTEMSLPVQVTYVDNAEKTRGGNAFLYNLKKTWSLAKKLMEGEMYFGGYLNSTLSSVPISTSEGMENQLSTHVYTATSLSRMDLWDIIGEWSQHNKEGGGLHCSGSFRAMVSEWAIGHMTLDQSAKEFGLDIEQILTPFGRYDLVDVDLFGQEANLMGTVFGVPYGQMGYRPLVHHDNLDIKYVPINRDEVHSKEGELYGVFGWQYHEEEMWMTINGLRFAG